MPAILLATIASTAHAQQEEWTGAYRCGPMKSDPAGRPGYSSPARLTVKDGNATLARDSGRIRESLAGKVAADGELVLEGTGQLKDSGASWRLRFEGRFQGARFEASGAMYPQRGGAALRDCSMTLTRIAGPARDVKAPPPPPPPAPKEVAPPPPAIAKAEPPPAPKAPEPSPPRKAEPPPAVKAFEPSAAKKAEPPPATKAESAPADRPREVDPAVRAALESPAPVAEQAKPGFLEHYSRSDLIWLGVFIVCAIAGVALLIYDWRRNH